MKNKASIVVAIATTGRAAVLCETLTELRRQSRRPDLVAICPAQDGDIDHGFLDTFDLPVTLSRSMTGACAQRNALLRDMPDVDIVLFLDDDFFPAPDYLERLEALFATHPDVVLATGALIADGATGPGFNATQARDLIGMTSPNQSERIAETFSGYGCNMAVRWSALARHEVRFDENLPLYSWAEDVEFSRQVARYGRLVKADALRGVHLACKRGRTSDLRLGYSQIANQVYLTRKGVIPARLAILHAGRNLLANLRGMVRSETYVDRRGRLLGNLYGLVDLVRGRSSPLRILEL